MKFPKKELIIIVIWLLSFFAILKITPFVFDFFQPAITGLIIALIVYPIVRFLEKKLKIIKAFGITLVSISIVLMVFGIGYFVLSFLYNEIYSFILDIPYLYEVLNNTIANLVKELEKFSESFPLINQYIDILNNFEITLPNANIVMEYLGDFTDSIFKFAKSLPDLIINIVFVCLFAILLILHMQEIKEFISNKLKIDINKSDDNNIYLIFSKLKDIFSGYIMAQVKLLFITFIIVFTGFLIVDIKYVFLISLLTAFLDMLPFFGTGTVLGPYAVISFIYGNYKIGIGCIIIYFITFIIRRVIEPKLVGKSVGVGPLFSVFCMFVGYKSIGILGLIFGIPIGVIVLYLYKLGFFNNLINSAIYVKKYLQYMLFETNKEKENKKNDENNE